MIFQLPFGSHTRFLESLSDIPHLQSTLHSRYIGFMKGIEASKKPHLNLLFMMLKDNKMSNTGQNVDFLMKKYQFSEIQELFMNKSMIKYMRVYELQKEELWKTKIIEELCLMKLGLLEASLNEHEIDFLLEEISAN